MSETNKVKSNYITICGNRDPIRYGGNRLINLTEFLPTYLKEQSDIFDFTQFFEGYLNEMYSGTEGYIQTSATVVSAYGGTTSLSADMINIDSHSNSLLSASADPRISILEKVYRLTETHDPDLIDLDFLQHFASYLGYDIDVNRGELGTFENDGVCYENVRKKYLRFMVSNLPHWYKIKTTTNAVKVMLFSFGLVADIVNYYTDDYENNWKHSNISWNTNVNQLTEDLSEIPDSYFPTPHMAVLFNINKSRTNYSFDVNQQQSIIKAIESVRPINTVFEGVHGYFLATTPLYMVPLSRCRGSLSLISDTPADYWN